MKRLLPLLSALLIPVCALLVLQGVALTTIGMLLIAGSSLLLIANVVHRARLQTAVCAVLLVVGGALVVGHPSLFLYYPVAASLAVASIFITSYWRSRPLIEQIAMHFESDLPAQARVYCRIVNHIWSIFLLVNACIALYLATPSTMPQWALYNGALSYMAIAILFCIEFIARQLVKRSVHQKQQALA